MQNEEHMFHALYRQHNEKGGKLGYLDFSCNIDSPEFASPEGLSDLEVVDRPFFLSFLILIHL